MNFVLYKLKLGHNTAESSKNIYCEKGAADHKQMVQEILLGLNEALRSDQVR